MRMVRHFLNDYFVLWNTYTTEYGGMLLCGVSLPKFIDMISVFSVVSEPNARAPPHLLPWRFLYVKTPFWLISTPQATILPAPFTPFTNLNCMSPFTVGNSSTGKSQGGCGGKSWQKSTKFVLSMSHVTHKSSTCERQRHRTSPAFPSIG